MAYKEFLNAEIEDFALNNSLTALFDKIYFLSFVNYTKNYWDFDLFIKPLVDRYFDNAIAAQKTSGNIGLKEEIATIASHKMNKRYDILLSLEDELYFNQVIAVALDFLKGQDFLFFQKKIIDGSQILFDLAGKYGLRFYKTQVLDFFANAYTFAKKYADENRTRSYSDGLPDPTTLLVIVQAIGSMPAIERAQFLPTILEIYEFLSHDDSSYDANQDSGYVALELSKYNGITDLTVINRAIEITGQNYMDNTYVHQTMYAKWLLEENVEEPLMYLKDYSILQSPDYVVMALADLNCKESIPLLVALVKVVSDPVTREVIEEAIRRLNTQNERPLPETRMVLLVGRLSPTQRAILGDNDNVFAQRAELKSRFDSTVYETDEE